MLCNNDVVILCSILSNMLCLWIVPYSYFKPRSFYSCIYAYIVKINAESKILWLIVKQILYYSNCLAHTLLLVMLIFSTVDDRAA